VLRVGKPTRWLLLLRDPEREGGRSGAEGYKWSWANGGHGNDLWLIVVTDRHAA